MQHFLSIDDMSAADISALLDTADSFRHMADRPIKKVPALRGRTVCNLFYEPSTRTRTSFELAAKRLSADVVNFSADSKSSVAKGESLKDTAWTIEAMGVDAIVLRHPASGAAHQLAGWVKAKVINAGDGQHEHPTQALLDLFTIRSHFKEWESIRVAVVGDIVHSRVARSLVKGLTKMGSDVILCGPPTLVPREASSWGVTRTTHSLDDIAGEVDVLYALRVQKERQQEQLFPSTTEYARLWGIDETRLAAMKPDAIVMHPGPMNRGIEISAAVADSPQAAVLEQVGNGVAVRMSLLYSMLGGPVGATP